MFHLSILLRQILAKAPYLKGLRPQSDKSEGRRLHSKEDSNLRYISTVSLWTILFCSILVTTCLGQERLHTASDQSFTVRLPSSFGPAASPPKGTKLAVEIPNTGIYLFCSKGEAVDLSLEIFAEKMKRNLYDGGAQLFGRAKAPLAGKPAASFLVGGVVPGKESLFIFNQRPDAVYTFVLSYPRGQRRKASKLWNSIAPTFKFK